MWNAAKCDLCGDCLTRCQYVDYDKAKTVTEIKLLMDGKRAEILNKCTTCCGCREYCPTGADPYDLIIKMLGKYNAPIIQAGVKYFEPVAFLPNEVIKGDPTKPVLSLCVVGQFVPQDAIGGQMFDGMTTVKGKDYFCYFGYVHAKESIVAENAQKFVDTMASLGKEIVFLHDECYSMIHAVVKDYGIKVPFKYMHILEYMRNYLRDNKNKIKKLNIKVAYQRPCSSRYTPEKDVLIDEIFDLIGVQRPRREYERENALCCGTVFDKKIFPELAASVQVKNIDDAIRSGADALITLCPVCDRVLRRPTSSKSLNKIHIAELCRMALGEKPLPQN